MIAIVKRVIGSLAVVLAASNTAMAAFSPIGVWMDPNGRGAVEITDCDGKLCGRIVWVKEQRDQHGCNFQMIGNVKPVGRNTWGGGWIIDPSSDRNKKYAVEITPLSDRKLRVMGYEGLKIFSETMTLTRAPADLKKCDEDVAKPAVEPAMEPAAEPAPTVSEDIPRRTAALRPAPRIAPTPVAAAPAAKPGKSRASADKPKACEVKIFGLAIPCEDLE
jgi:uncharacterized protein (DUF2147 family)